MWKNMQKFKPFVISFLFLYLLLLLMIQELPHFFLILLKSVKSLLLHYSISHFFSFSCLPIISSSNFYLYSIFYKTLSAILFMNSWTLSSVCFISQNLFCSCFSSILEYYSWAFKSSNLSNSWISFCLNLFFSFSRSIFWRYSLSCHLFSYWIFLSASISIFSSIFGFSSYFKMRPQLFGMSFQNCSISEYSNILKVIHKFYECF